MVGHLQAVSDPLEDVLFLDLPLAVDDIADASLPESNRSADTDLADPGVVVDQPEQCAHVAFGKSAGNAGVLPERGGDIWGLKCAGPHGAPCMAGMMSELRSAFGSLRPYLTGGTPTGMGSVRRSRNRGHMQQVHRQTKSCPACRGRGWKFHRSRRTVVIGTLTRGATVAVRRTCPSCDGSGRVDKTVSS